jgi:alpha-L-arabinofuranosidase
MHGRIASEYAWEDTIRICVGGYYQNIHGRIASEYAWEDSIGICMGG